MDCFTATVMIYSGQEGGIIGVDNTGGSKQSSQFALGVTEKNILILWQPVYGVDILFTKFSLIGWSRQEN